MDQRRVRASATAAGVVAVIAVSFGAAAQSSTAQYQEPYRPQFHFSPATNWSNDPNGLVYHDGEYHLFFQHNPFGNVWGNMSWGHAVSRDLVHWEHLPVALRAEGHEAVFSGSVVVDERNTSGFGTAADPPMVAVYTSARPGSQAQALAYSTDRGRTWTKYSGNPVLDIGSSEFRDPKVFWHEPEQRWVMAVALPVERKVALYASRNLIEWQKLSEFGPANAVGGGWETPDLFPLEVDGNPGKQKWVLIVSLNPGAIAGGSGTQYFVGDFDGTRFRADGPPTYTPPSGDVYADFEGAGYGPWTTTGSAFGTGPAAGTLPGQQPVSGFEGTGLVNSFRDGDGTTGTLTSPPFTIRRPYVNLLVGGGAHVRETAVNLLVDDQVVRTASGEESERLDWIAWNVADLVGREARIEVVDRNTGGWGHILADQITFADAPALSSKQRSSWLDYGKDNYAAVSWNGVPGGRRLIVGWMSNWQYADLVPTSPWRGAMTVPRQLRLETIDGRPQLVQEPTPELRAVRGDLIHRADDRPLPEGTQALGDGARGQTLEVEAVLRARTARELGLEVRVGADQATVIGYDVRAQELYVDRRRSGDTGFSSRFPGVQRAPLRLRNGKVRLHILVDRSSVEVFADRGQVVLTDQVLPDAASDEVRLFARGGDAEVKKLRIRSVRSIWP
jgi:sucrose-6-phosphate hydrolase SacC (GH32 family)